MRRSDSIARFTALRLVDFSTASRDRRPPLLESRALCPMEVSVPRNPLFTGMAVSTADKLKCSNQDVLRQGRKGARENMEMLKN